MHNFLAKLSFFLWRLSFLVLLSFWYFLLFSRIYLCTWHRDINNMELSWFLWWLVEKEKDVWIDPSSFQYSMKPNKQLTTKYVCPFLQTNKLQKMCRVVYLVAWASCMLCPQSKSHLLTKKSLIFRLWFFDLGTKIMGMAWDKRDWRWDEWDAYYEWCWPTV
jgi:hypothetical protein